MLRCTIIINTLVNIVLKLLIKQNMYSALILDDEIASINTLKILLEKKCKQISIIYTAQTINEASIIILRKKPDIVFSDIKMPEMNGLDFLNSFKQKTFKSIIVTAYNDYGIKAIKAGVNDYLIKPIISDELSEAVNRVIEQIELDRKPLNFIENSDNNDVTTDKIIIKDELENIILGYNEIIMMVALNNYTKIFLLNGKNYVAPHTLKWFEEKAPKNLFYRIHKSYLINISFIESFSLSKDRKVNLVGGNVARIAANKTGEFKKLLKK